MESRLAQIEGELCSVRQVVLDQTAEVSSHASCLVHHVLLYKSETQRFVSVFGI